MPLTIRCGREAAEYSCLVDLLFFTYYIMFEGKMCSIFPKTHVLQKQSVSFCVFIVFQLYFHTYNSF